MGKQRFEFDDGRSSKFWEISVSGKSHTVQYGRIGTGGQSRTKSFKTPQLAQSDADKMIRQKTNKGYTVVKTGKRSPCKNKIPSSIKYRAKSSVGSGSVEDAWQRIEAWLQINLPATYKSLRKPAKQKEIRAFEKHTGLTIPKDLKRSFQIHDGQDEASAGIIFGLPIVSISGMHALWKHNDAYEKSKKRKFNFDDNSQSFPAGFVQPVYRSRGWLPISHDSGGNSLVVDLLPDKLGTTGQITISDRDGFHPVLAASWGQFLSDIAIEMERGNWKIENQGDYTEFNLGVPANSHFHDIGVDWAKRKLGLRNLDTENESVWMERTFTTRSAR